MSGRLEVENTINQKARDLYSALKDAGASEFDIDSIDGIISDILNNYLSQGSAS